MNRYRIVTVTDNPDGHEEHISSVIINLEEAMIYLGIEEMIAERAGWKVQPRLVTGDVVCERDTTKRRIGIRASTPFDDIVA